MPLPANFGHWEHLQDMLRREHNKLIARYFKDLGGSDWTPDVSTSRGALRVACTIDDNDTVNMVILRFFLFYIVLGYFKRSLGIFYGLPSEQYQESVVFCPQIFLYFSQDRGATPDGYDPLSAEISFRLTSESSITINEVKALELARNIKRIFVEGNKGITFTKGRVIVSYKDKTNGYDLRIYASSSAEGEQVIRKVLDIRNHPYDSDRMSVSIPQRQSTNTSTMKTVYGKQRKTQRWRPTATVRFRYAYLSVHGLKEPVYLVDAGGLTFDSLV